MVSILPVRRKSRSTAGRRTPRLGRVSDPAARRPMIVLVAPHHEDVLRGQFGRYDREYDVRCTTSAQETTELLLSARADSVPVALLVTESVLPDSAVHAAFAAWRGIVPTVRRIVAAHWSRFMLDADRLRPGLATGKYDAYLLMPRGDRDEEFHTAVTELLSDWGSTVAAPEVASAEIITPGPTVLTAAIQDYLDRMGMPTALVSPDSERGRELLAPYDGPLDFPVFSRIGRPSVPVSAVRDVATMIYGTPGDIEVDQVVDLVVVGAGPAGLAAAV